MATCEASVRKSEEALDAGIRVYGELPICETQAEWNRWMAYESLANRVFAHRPVVLMCGYDRRVVPEAVVHQAWQTHRVVHASVWQLSREYEEPEVLVPSLEPPFEPLPGLRSLPIGDGRLEDRLADELIAERVPEGRARDLLVAAREVLINAERYGNGVRAFRVGRVGERFVCEIKDAGAGLDDPFAGYLPPARQGARRSRALDRTAADVAARAALRARRADRQALDLTLGRRATDGAARSESGSARDRSSGAPRRARRSTCRARRPRARRSA